MSFCLFFVVVKADADFFPGVLDTPCKRTKVAKLGRSSPRLERCVDGEAIFTSSGNGVTTP